MHSRASISNYCCNEVLPRTSTKFVLKISMCKIQKKFPFLTNCFNDYLSRRAVTNEVSFLRVCCCPQPKKMAHAVEYCGCCCQCRCCPLTSAKQPQMGGNKKSMAEAQQRPQQQQKQQRQAHDAKMKQKLYPKKQQQALRRYSSLRQTF